VGGCGCKLICMVISLSRHEAGCFGEEILVGTVVCSEVTDLGRIHRWRLGVLGYRLLRVGKSEIQFGSLQ
jgi:hypothetical protein